MPQTTETPQRKTWSSGHYPWTLSKAGTEKPKGENSFTLKGSEKGPKGRMSTAGFALSFHILLLLRLQVPILTPISYDQIRLRKCCRCRPPAWTGRQDRLLSGPIHLSVSHSATSLGSHSCTCCLTQSQETQNPRLGLPP